MQGLMNLKTVLFDLDGTLLPMDQDVFVQAYMGGMARHMAPHGYDPKALVSSVWTGTGAMVKNDGTMTNEEVFWACFDKVMGRNTRVDEPHFEEYYRTGFQKVKEVCGFAPMAAEVIAFLKNAGCRVALATNPLFPRIATCSRARWAGLDPEDFALITTYENSQHCKPNPDYYRDILAELDETPENCIMVGNDVGEDMVAAALGMQVFLLTDCVINKQETEVSHIPQGSFPELLEFLKANI